MRKFIIVLACSLAILSGCVSFDYSSYEKDRAALPGAAEILPDVELLERVADTRYNHKTKREALIFVTETMAVQLDMTPEMYAAEKARLLAASSFQTVPPKDAFGHICIDETEVTVYGYDFRLLSTPSSSYPKVFGFIGFDDSNCSIAWLYCNDPDRDYVESEDFITEFFF